MADLRTWLRHHKLEQYADAFEANDIGLDILPELTEDDLEQLGVSLGNRRRLKKALAEGLPLAGEPAPKPGPEPYGDAERRQVTVLFCDLVGSTALSGAIDPELLGQVIQRYQSTAAAVIGRFGGFVAKFMGDGILAYFGFPQAFEDAAERAVRAALGILAEACAIERPDGTHAQVRIGIATGLVVVGEIIGDGPAQERTIVGETPNLAARLQALAQPDTILISETTQLLVGGLFDLEPTGPHELKGFARPVPAWRVRCEAVVESRFAASRTGASLPLIGRAHEIGLILDRWRLARHGEGQVVTVVGEAGIGKSRSIEALQDKVDQDPHIRVHLQCSPYRSDSALYPVIQHLGRAARFGTADSAEARIEKLRALFAQRAAADPNAVALLAELLSIPLPQPAVSMAPAQRKTETIALLVDELIRLGDTNPVLLVLEDAHWIDATTLELMSRLIDSVGDARLLVLVTARPEFTPPWLARPHVTMLTLGRLSRAECAQLVAGVAASHGLSSETIAAIVTKTDGVPLFAEELTKSVMESAAGDSASVPATLKDSLMARLDRLGEAREVAQIAAVIGRLFPVELIDAVASRSSAEISAAIDELVAAGIVFPEGRGALRTFSFKHALVRDAAYESLLLARRRDWHERIARALEDRFPEAAANEPELLAYHFGEAGLLGPACDYRMRAGERAIGQSAYREALGHFSSGLKAAEALPDAADRMRRQLDFLLKLGPVLMPLRGMHSAEVEDTYRRAADIATALGDDAAAFKAKWGLWINANIGRKTAVARDRATELVALAQHSGDGDLLLEAYHCRWSTAFFRGDVADGLEASRIGVESYELSRHRHLGHAFGGHDPGVCAHVIYANSLQLTCDREGASGHAARAVALADEINYPNTIGHALHSVCQCHQLAGEREITLALAQRGAALAEKFGLALWRAGCLMLTAWASATGDGIADAVRLAESEIDRATAVGPLPQYYLGLTAEIMLAAGRAGDGLGYADRAIATVGEPGVGFYLPEIYRLRGACLLALSRDNQDEARRAFTTARDIAERQGAILLRRRADAALADLGV